MLYGLGPWPTPTDQDRPDRHTVADHRLGADLAHVHDGDADHDHDDFVDGPIEDNPLWIADNVTLTSVGIDIGSAGTQVIFSKVHLRRLSEELTSRYYVVGRETLFRSPVALTPYQSEERIDDAQAARHHRRGLQVGRAQRQGHRHRRGDPHRRGAAARQRAGDRGPAGRARRRLRHRHRRPSHGGDAGGLRLGRRARVLRPGQAHPQHRHRRRHHQARAGRERPGDRDRRHPHRRPLAGGRRRAAASSGSIRPASITPRRRAFTGTRATAPSPPRSTRSPSTWPTR